MNPLEKLHEKVVNCTRCQRLRSYCSTVAQTRKRAYRNEEYWGKPVPGFGDPEALIWILGLAPGAHGANRTGRMFTGDSSGEWLFDALFQSGFSNQRESLRPDDFLKLSGVYISAAARCAPPQNKPTTKELANCSSFLDVEYKTLKNAWLFIALGKISFDATLKLLASEGLQIPSPKPKFRHGAYYDFGSRAVLASYHPSRQNTQTGRLTKPMWNSIFQQACRLKKLKNHASGKRKIVSALKTNRLDVPAALGKF